MLITETNTILQGEKAEKDIHRLQMKYAPYFIIVIFASITAILRFYLMPSFGWWHLPLLAYQVLIFIGFWQLIKYVNKRLNFWYPLKKGP